jgi:hypothetical protein
MPTQDEISVAELLTEHYRDTMDRTNTFFQQRNRIFLILLAVIAIGTLITFRTKQTESLLLIWITKGLDQKSVDAIRNSFPFALLETLLLVVVFFLMVNLYHRARFILRNYQYLGLLEAEIRKQLALGQNSTAFTRESTIYWTGRASSSRRREILLPCCSGTPDRRIF